MLQGESRIAWQDKSAGLPDLVTERRREAVRGMEAGKQLRFPPINLWVMASHPSAWLPANAGKATHTHRRQRPGLKLETARANALQTVKRNVNRRLESLLALRGGKL